MPFQLFPCPDCILDQCCPVSPGGIHTMCLKRRGPQVSPPKQTVSRKTGQEQCGSVHDLNSRLYRLVMKEASYFNISFLFLFLQLHSSRRISSFPRCVSRRRWKWPSLLTPVLATMKTQTTLRLSCSTKNFLPTPRRQPTSPNWPKGPKCLRPLVGSSSSSRVCTNVPSVTNASSTTLS